LTFKTVALHPFERRGRKETDAERSGDTVVCVNHHALRWQSRGSEKGAVAKGGLLLSDK